MQLSLTSDQISGARNNNLGDITAVLAAMDHRIQWHANHYASTGGRIDRDLADDLAQDARFALWRAIERFEGTEVPQFFSFADRTIRRRPRRQAPGDDPAGSEPPGRQGLRDRTHHVRRRPVRGRTLLR